MALVADLGVMAGALVLLLGGFSKIVQPRPIAGTLALLWNRATGQARAAGSPLLGWLLGAGEVVLASAMACTAPGRRARPWRCSPSGCRPRARSG